VIVQYFTDSRLLTSITWIALAADATIRNPDATNASEAVLKKLVNSGKG
jgi:hypothetical protein